MEKMASIARQRCLDTGVSALESWHDRCNDDTSRMTKVLNLSLVASDGQMMNVQVDERQVGDSLYEAAGVEDSYLTCNGKVVRRDVALWEQGIGNESIVHVHRRLRGGLDTIELVLIIVGCVLGLVFLWWMMPKIFRCLGWFWRKVIGPPLIWIYDYIFTPIGHCTRDCIFTSKEACCDCCDAVDVCCNPYKRI